MIKFNCINCKKVIYKYPYQIKNSKTGVFFCSKKCHYNHGNPSNRGISRSEDWINYFNKNIGGVTN